MKIEAVIVAAGMGTRLKARKPKALISLAGQPLFLYALKVFLKNALIDSVVLVVPPGNENKFQALAKRVTTRKTVKIVAGGKCRSESVHNGLARLDEDTQGVLIHDAARPFVSEAMIKSVCAQLLKEAAVTVAVGVKPTIKRVDPKTGYVQATLDRRFLWDIQTPQGFHKGLILKAHQAAVGETATDDAFLVEQIGAKVKIIPGDERNMKITTPEDLKIAQVLLKGPIK